MKAIALAVLLAAPLACAQGATPAPNLPDLDHLFQTPQAGRKPQFKLQIPNGQTFFTLPEATLMPAQPPIKPDADPGVLLKPRGFDHQRSWPAPNRKLYPDLTVMPIEIAQLGPAASPWPMAKGEPIPTTWPNAKFEPIPTTWNGFRMVPVAGFPSPGKSIR